MQKMFKIILNTVKNMGILNKLVGNTGEYYVEKTLKKNGFHVKHRNYRTKNFEIDIIAKKDNETYIFEVKTIYTDEKNKDSALMLGELVNKKKRDRLIAFAEMYMNNNKLENIEIYLVRVLLLKKHLEPYSIDFIAL